MKSTLISGPPRFRFRPTSWPLHFACSMRRSRRNSVFDLRRLRLTPAARYDGYLASMQSAISEPLLLLQEPGLLPPPGLGDGPLSGTGIGAGASKILKLLTADQLLSS